MAIGLSRELCQRFALDRRTYNFLQHLPIEVIQVNYSQSEVNTGQNTSNDQNKQRRPAKTREDQVPELKAEHAAVTGGEHEFGGVGEHHSIQVRR